MVREPKVWVCLAASSRASQAVGIIMQAVLIALVLTAQGVTTYSSTQQHTLTLGSAGRQLVLKGERHTATHFLGSILRWAFDGRA